MGEVHRKIGLLQAIVLIIGILFIAIAALALIDPGLTAPAVAKLYFCSILMLGAVGIIRGFSPVDVTGRKLPPIRRNFELALGVVGVMLALTGLLYPGWTTLFLMYIVAFSFIVLGTQAFLAGMADSNLMPMGRAAMAALGLAAVVISSSVFWIPMISIALSVAILASCLALLGMQLIISVL